MHILTTYPHPFIQPSTNHPSPRLTYIKDTYKNFKSSTNILPQISGDVTLRYVIFMVVSTTGIFLHNKSKVWHETLGRHDPGTGQSGSEGPQPFFVIPEIHRSSLVPDALGIGLAYWGQTLQAIKVDRV